ncbi:MAG: hypothetical protein JNJ90_03865 [Saprospiraceae bacterium]|jgi:hypothetical protein|nr:hypothetical protein [Saprospiraceae bacterium]
MKYTILLLSMLLLAASCKQDKPGAADQTTDDAQTTRTALAGYWIAMDFCSRANQYGSVLGAMNNAHIPYAYAYEFDPNKPDSVICYNGFETWLLPVAIDKDTIEVKGAGQGKSIYLMYQSKGNKEITSFDGTQGSVKMDRYVKSKAEVTNGYAAFTAALNHNLFGGILLPIGSRDTVIFAPDGFILKWKTYNKYNVCTGGDCFVAEEAMDVITLSDNNKPGSEKMYGFKYNGTNDTLTFYNLVNTKPDEKFAYEIKGPAFKFRRVPPQF